jgi:hypothetical protein
MPRSPGSTRRSAGARHGVCEAVDDAIGGLTVQTATTHEGRARIDYEVEWPLPCIRLRDRATSLWTASGLQFQRIESTTNSVNTVH